ncbi:unnamed protein product [Phytophthora lilii]|uniref:Unnamed protein product n=1 Tax=Phytophthora lilii TaxID=2077276 RepID=A0A9W6WUS5_9STRA|nr:unnamed protein product [Phytophthora lilii]
MTQHGFTFRSLQRDFPVDLIKPSLAADAFYTGLSVRREVSEPEQVSFERYRQRLQEFDREEYGPSPAKRQKVAFEKVNHAREQNKHNDNLFRRLRSELSQRRDHCRIGGVNFGVMEKWIPIREEKRVAAVKEDNQDASDSETKTILEEILLDEIYTLAEDVYDEEEEKSRNKELPPDLLKIVEDALHEGPMEEVIIQKYNVDITRRHLQVLLPMTWLNDEVRKYQFIILTEPK